MKTLSGKLKYVVLAAILALAIFTFRAFAQPWPVPPEPTADQATFVLKIKKTAMLKNEDHFRAVLKTLNTKLYDFVLVHHEGKSEHVVPGGSAKLDIKTDKVIASDLAKSGGLTLIQVHATQHLASSSATEIQTIANEFQ